VSEKVISISRDYDVYCDDCKRLIPRDQDFDGTVLSQKGNVVEIYVTCSNCEHKN
jgi:hypothetical protein